MHTAVRTGKASQKNMELQPSFDETLESFQVKSYRTLFCTLGKLERILRKCPAKTFSCRYTADIAGFSL